MLQTGRGSRILRGVAALLLLSAVVQGSQAGAAAPLAGMAEVVAPESPDGDEIFWRQPERVARAASEMAAGQAGNVDVFFVGFAGDDSQEIFAREARLAAEAVAGRIDPPGHSLLLLNNHAANASGSPIASIGTIQLALEELTRRMDVAEDVLFLYLTSHGLPRGELYVSNGDLPLEQIDPARLRQVLDRFGFRRRIIVVSACFSGNFARELADESTVVLTAARSDRPSFGCRDSRGLTYFGEALWQYALPRADTLIQAFALALTRVSEMEREAQLVPSEPQMFVGSEARSWLDQIAMRPAQRSAGLLAVSPPDARLAGAAE